MGETHRSGIVDYFLMQMTLLPNEGYSVLSLKAGNIVTSYKDNFYIYFFQFFNHSVFEIFGCSTSGFGMLYRSQQSTFHNQVIPQN